MIIGMTVGLVKPLQTVLFAPGQPLQVVGLAIQALASACVPIINLMMAFSLGIKLKTLNSCTDLLGSEDAGVSSRTLAVSTLGRMIILPAIHGTILYALLDQLPEGRLFRTIPFIEMAPPTASIVVVLAHLADMPKQAQLLAFAIVPQYIIAVVTLTLWCAFALYVTI